MNTEMKNRVLELLDNYHKRARLIALLRYELAHPAQVTEKDLIGAMNFARQEGAGRPEGHISNQTLYIALNYQDQARQLNAETFQEISAQLMKLEQEQDRLNYYLSLLEPRQEQVLRKAYLEKVPQEQVARELGVSVRSVQDIKAKAIDALAEMYAFTAGLN